MFVIDDKIISTELFSQQFICNLSACKGACCWEGDFGAPITDQEHKKIEEILEKIIPLLSLRSATLIQEEGISSYNATVQSKVTSLHKDGSCAFLTKNSEGIARCAFEIAFEKGKTDFKKPISCHLYPVRVTENKKANFEALNYDEWEICQAACALGKEHKTPVFRFLKDALIRKYGIGFYDQMEDIYKSYFL